MQGLSLMRKNNTFTLGSVALTALLLIWYPMRFPLNGTTRDAQHPKNAVSVGCDPGVHPLVCSLRVKLSES